jgi:hypothetical protein
MHVFLAAFRLYFLAAAYFGIRHLQKNNIEVGEARFKSPNTDS